MNASEAAGGFGDDFQPLEESAAVGSAAAPKAVEHWKALRSPAPDPLAAFARSWPLQ
jgi:hypothetical protein